MVLNDILGELTLQALYLDDCIERLLLELFEQLIVCDLELLVLELVVAFFVAVSIL